MSPFAPIRSLARAGATERAWAMFEAGGHMGDTGNAEALTLKGRLLKDKALLARGRERRRLYAESGAAYAAAAALSPASYPLINAATVALLGGEPGEAGRIASETLELLESGEMEGETPYWIAATRAEALLLMGRSDEARPALADAMAAAPQAWEDHASTLRQFALILGERGEDAGWLDRHRPPPSLHFSGIIGIDPADRDAPRAIDDALAGINPGFGFGALAAGADILAAEALQRRGAQLHVVLPCAVEQFRQLSVARVGKGWAKRFDALIDAAETLQTLDGQEPLSDAAVAIADEMAMGLALRQAAMLESRAVALRVRDSGEADTPSLAADALWEKAEREIVSVAVRRASPPPTLATLPHQRKEALLALSGEEAERADRDYGAGALWRSEHRGHLVLGFATPGEAAGTAGEIAGSSPGGLRIGMDYRAIAPSPEAEAMFDQLLLIADGAGGGLPLASAPMALALALHAPHVHCEPAGEIKSCLGDIPYWTIRAAAGRGAA